LVLLIAYGSWYVLQEEIREKYLDIHSAYFINLTDGVFWHNSNQIFATGWN